jgi:hypothetical protein
MTRIYQDMIASGPRTRQVVADVAEALARGRNCLVLTRWTAHLEAIAGMLRDLGREPVILRGGTGARARAAAVARLQPRPGGPPLLAVATAQYAGEGFDCPALDTLFLAAPVVQPKDVTQYVGRILRPFDGKVTAEVHDYHDELTGVLASSLARRAPGYTQLGFPDPRKASFTPSAAPPQLAARGRKSAVPGRRERTGCASPGARAPGWPWSRLPFADCGGHAAGAGYLTSAVSTTTVVPYTSTTALLPSSRTRVPGVPRGMTFPVLSRTSLIKVTAVISLPFLPAGRRGAGAPAKACCWRARREPRPSPQRSTARSPVPFAGAPGAPGGS